MPDYRRMYRKLFREMSDLKAMSEEIVLKLGGVIYRIEQVQGEVEALHAEPGEKERGGR